MGPACEGDYPRRHPTKWPFFRRKGGLHSNKTTLADFCRVILEEGHKMHAALSVTGNALMRTKYQSLVLLVVLALTSAVSAQNLRKPPGQRPGNPAQNFRQRNFGQGNMRQRPQFSQAQRAAFLRRFDRNGDGRLDQNERALAQQAFRNGNRGNKNPQFRNPQQPFRVDQLPASVRKRYDANKNGRLDPAEIQKLRGAMQRRGRSTRGNRGRMNGPFGNPGQAAKDGAKDGKKPNPPVKANDAKPGQRQLPAAVIRRFDADGNGRLDPRELQKLRAVFQQRQQAGVGQNRVGNAPPQADRLDQTALLKRFDENQNGRLDPAELQKAMLAR